MHIPGVTQHEHLNTGVSDRVHPRSSVWSTKDSAAHSVVRGSSIRYVFLNCVRTCHPKCPMECSRCAPVTRAKPKEQCNVQCSPPVYLRCGVACPACAGCAARACSARCDCVCLVSSAKLDFGNKFALRAHQPCPRHRRLVVLRPQGGA